MSLRHMVKPDMLFNSYRGAWWGKDTSDHSQGVWVPALSQTHCRPWTALTSSSFQTSFPICPGEDGPPTEEMLQHSKPFKGKFLQINLFFDNLICSGHTHPSTFFYPLLTSSAFSNQVFHPISFSWKENSSESPFHSKHQSLIPPNLFSSTTKTPAMPLFFLLPSRAELAMSLHSNWIQKKGPLLEAKSEDEKFTRPLWGS